MKRILAALLATVAVSAQAATHLYFDLNAPNFNASPASNRWVTLQPQTPFVGNLVNYTSGAAGTFYASNLYAGDYAGQIKQKGQATAINFQVTVLDGDSGIVGATNRTTLSGVQTYPQSGRTAWTIQASDARYSQTNANDFTGAQITNMIDGRVGSFTNGYTSVVYSNPASFYWASNPSNYVTAVTVTNATNGLASAFASADTVVSNGLSTRLINTNSTLAALVAVKANTNAPTLYNATLAGTTTNAGDLRVGNDAIVVGDLNIDGINATGTIGTTDVFEGNGSSLTNIPLGGLSLGARQVITNLTTDATNGLNSALVSRVTTTSNGLVALFIAADTVVSNGLSVRLLNATNGLTVALIAATNDLNTVLGGRLDAKIAATNTSTVAQILSATNVATAALITRITAATNDLNTVTLARYGTAARSNTAAFVLAPTNSGSDGQVVSLTGNKTKWITETGGSGTGIATNSGSGTNNWFDSPTITNAPGIQAAKLYATVATNGTLFVTNAVTAGSGAFTTSISVGGLVVAAGGRIVANPSGSGSENFVTGSSGNAIGGGTDANTIVGGQNNSIGQNSDNNGIVAGNGNVAGIDASHLAQYGFIGGGGGNVIAANGATAQYSAIPGGRDNAVSNSYAFAMGRGSIARNAGSTVLSDSQATTTMSPADDTLSLRFQGGVGLNTTNVNGAALRVSGAVASDYGTNAVGTITNLFTTSVTESNLYAGAWQLLQWHTNVVAVTNATTASANGQYHLLGSTYTNAQTGTVITNVSAGVWQIRLVATVLYTSATVANSSGWTPVSGSGATTVRSYYGTYLNADGVYVLGDFASTNVSREIADATNALSVTSSNLAWLMTQTNNSSGNSAGASNLYAGALTLATNIAAQQAQIATNSLAAAQNTTITNIANQAARVQIGNGTNTIVSTNFVGNGINVTNLSGTNITGTLTNNTTGNAATSTLATNAFAASMSGIVTNGDLSINVDAVPQLDSALRYSNQISVVVFGDSVGNYIWKSAPKLFDNFSTYRTAKGSLRYSGYSGDGWGGWLNTLNSGTGPSTFDTVLDSWWGDSQIYMVVSGTSNVWSVGGTGTATGKLNGNLLKFWYLASATNGTIVVETSTDGTTYVPRIVQDESAPSRGLVCTNIALATADYYVRVSAGSGRCQYLWPQIINTNSRAFHIANLCAGGRTMLDLMNMGTNNIATLLTNLWPPTTLIAYVDTKSVSTYTNWFKVKYLFDTYSTNSDVIVGKPQPSTIASIESDPAEGTYYQSLVFNEIGRTNKIPFFDMRSSFADTNRSARLNFYANDGSGVHFNNNGQQALSDDFWLRLKIIPRLATTTNFNVKTVNDMFSVIGGTYNDTAYISNAWANGRSGLYFEPPDSTAANWAIAGSSSAMGLKSRAGFYVFCNYSTTAGAQWFTSGGLNLWGSGYANNEDPGIGGLVLAGNQTNYGHFAIAGVGKKFLIKEGSNAIMGVATLSGGTVVVSTTAVTANSRIQLTPQTLGTILRPAGVGVTARTAGTSFTITSSDVTDTSTVAWFIVEPN